VSEEGAEQNRSEKPSSFKLARARQKGSVARGMDLGFLTGLVAFVGYAWILGPSLVARLELVSRRAFVAAPNVVAAPNEILAVTGAVLGAAARPLGFMIATILLVVLVFEIAQTGFVFSGETLKLDFNRLNPATGLKRVFSLRMLVETGKNLAKMLVYGAIAVFVIGGAMRTAPAALADAQGLAQAMGRLGLRLLAAFVGGALIFAALDQFIVRRDFLKKMRMSRREMRRETRDREGEPRMKQRRKQLHREFVKLSESVRGIRGADVLLTNPTHYAVALRYDPRSMAAPVVVSRGAHQVAQRLRRLAFLYGVVIVRQPELARALYRCELGQPVPDSLYHPVAAVYRSLRDRPAVSGSPA